MQVYISKHLRDIISQEEAKKKVNRLKKTWVRNGESRFKRATILPISWRPELAGEETTQIDEMIVIAVRRGNGTVNPMILEYVVKGSEVNYFRHFRICQKKKIEPEDPEFSLPPRFRKVLAM